MFGCKKHHRTCEGGRIRANLGPLLSRFIKKGTSKTERGVKTIHFRPTVENSIHESQANLGQLLWAVVASHFAKWLVLLWLSGVPGP